MILHTLNGPTSRKFMIGSVVLFTPDVVHAMGLFMTVLLYYFWIRMIIAIYSNRALFFSHRSRSKKHRMVRHPGDNKIHRNWIAFRDSLILSMVILLIADYFSFPLYFLGSPVSIHIITPNPENSDGGVIRAIKWLFSNSLLLLRYYYNI